MKRIFLSLAKKMGLFVLLRYINRNKIIVLTYHGVVSSIPETNRQYEYRNMILDKDFKWQLDFLSCYYNKISIEQFMDFREGKINLPQNPFLITFDDGYRNNLQVATPLLKEKGISAIFFITSGLIGSREELLWTDLITYLLFATKKKKVRVLLLNEVEFSLETEKFRELASIRIRSFLKNASKQEITRVIAALKSQLDDVESVTPNKYKERYEFLSWKEAINLLETGMVVGSHTVSHPILATLSLQMSKFEITKSKEEIEAHLKKPCDYFSYPNGKSSDFGTLHEKMLEEANYKCAFSQISGVNDKDTNRYALRRINIDSGLTPVLFEAKICGFIDLIKKLGMVQKRKNSTP